MIGVVHNYGKKITHIGKVHLGKTIKKLPEKINITSHKNLH